MRKHYLIRERPDVNPAYIICNAPRPLMGDAEWQGDFIHGVFYAGVLPDNQVAIEFNSQMDAWELVFVTTSEAKRMLKEAYPEKYHASIDSCNHERLAQLFHQKINK
jgi:hypothetical protein